ncbi:uncharacterized protein LOC126713718 [Quercus robur]|uniref:uncharacterized protein LOC126713718 n=1 Tax=Quercus robur TaxID=38942 RepID=UPI00216352AE|nr:uncharacterized protein LOC126713718 [Quercus robur]
MNYQSTSRNQMPKGFKVKHVLQLVLFLAVVIWLQYQLRQSNSNKKGNNYGESIQSKLSEDHGGIILGRKGNAGLSSDGGMTELEDVNLGEDDKRKDDGGGGDDEFDGNVEEEFFHKENEYSRGQFWTREKKENWKELELEHKDNNSDIGVGGKGESVGLHNHSVQGGYFKKGHDDSWSSVPDHDKKGDEKGGEVHDEEDDKDPKTLVKQGDDKVSGRQIKEPQHIEELTDDTLKKVQYEADHLNSNNKEDNNITESKREIAMQPSGTDNNATVLDRNEVLDGVLGFHDENGVPPDGSDLSKSMFTDSQDNYANIQHQETISNSSYQSRFSESANIAEVVTEEDLDAADLESRNKEA